MILILDNTVLLNCIDRCSSVDLIQKLSEYPLEMEIVETVHNEYIKGSKIYPDRCNLTLFNKHLYTTIKVIDDSKLTINRVPQLINLDGGELFSVVYLLENKTDRILCTDDKATHKVLAKFNIKCLWTINLLQLLYQRKPALLTYNQVWDCYKEMIAKGFYGLPTKNIDINAYINIKNYLSGGQNAL
ncbi:MAG: hypothetical protein QM209_06135 [Candidatus Cloacimonadota bacterium]|nr:hypothetical protein [Candidatus Cloacimonadota bacterium]HOE55128.1 hypothetical protein [Candidatus Cloacimonas acidaminovorans]HRS60760.1 hypothetical protein [Candidatus Cloacimonas sp.]HOM79281.1 hypothetical protein [Candidatus Cloacimonas acidaminovorans]HOS07204.1 hypothetical protein [Candidatus Cloacimonas acidaminovorans]